MVRVLALTFLVGAQALAQEMSPNDAQACTYDACALRLENGRVVRGSEGHRVFRLGAWGAPLLAPHVTASDSALRYAVDFDRHYAAGTRLSTLGLLGVSIIGVIFAEQGRGPAHFSDSQQIVVAAVGGVSLGLMMYGSRRLSRATRGLSRALWWYNRDLPR